MSAGSARQHGLDTLRAAAILLVYMYHYRVFVSGESSFGWFSEVGWIGVDLFFVLSGYLIASQLLKGFVAGHRLSFKVFYARRLLRTLPDFYVVLAAYWLLPIDLGGRTPPSLWRFLTFTQNWQLQPGTAFSHAWSLCIEEQFYVLLPAALWLAYRWRQPQRWIWGLLAVLVGGGVAMRALLWQRYGLEAGDAVAGYYPNIYYASLCRFDEFAPGVALALIERTQPALWARVQAHGNVLLGAGAAMFAALMYGLLNHYYIDGYGYGAFMTIAGYSLVALCFGLLTAAALSPKTVLHRWRVPGAASLALWSYAIYLSHKPLAHVLRGVLENHGIARTSGLAMAVIAVACLVCGAALYRCVEAPFMRLRARRVPAMFGRAPVTAAVAA